MCELVESTCPRNCTNQKTIMSDNGWNPNSMDSTLSRIQGQLSTLQDQLREFNATMSGQFRKLESRIETLETQRAWVIGVTTGISLAVGFVVTLVNKFLKL